MKKSNREIITALSYLTQLGLSVTVAFGIWIWIAEKVRQLSGLGNFVTVFGIIMGAVSGCIAFRNFCRQITLLSRKDEKDER